MKQKYNPQNQDTKMKPQCYISKGSHIKCYLENTKCCLIKKSSSWEESIPNQSRDEMLTKPVAGGSAPWTPDYRLPLHPLVSSHRVKWAPGRESSVYTYTPGIFCTSYFTCHLFLPKLVVAPITYETETKPFQGAGQGLPNLPAPCCTPSSAEH